MYHCVKSVHIWGCFGLHFPAFEMNMERYGVSPHSVQMREDADQNNLEYGNIYYLCNNVCSPMLFMTLPLTCFRSVFFFDL